jgi:hypothetical protein
MSLSVGPQNMKFLTLMLTIAFALAIGTAASNDEGIETVRVLHLVRAKDGSSVARELVRTFLTDAQWQDKVVAVRKRFKEWEVEHQEDAGSFLNNQFSAVVLAASGGNIEHLKDAAVWMAMYQEFEEPLPSYVSDFLERNGSSINALFANFSWKNASVYVKTKGWQKNRYVKTRER